MHLVIVQTPLAVMDNNTYNRQETGLAKALVKRGWRVSLIFTGYDEKTEEIDENIRIYYLRAHFLNQQFGYYVNLYKTLDMLQPDLLQIHEIGMFMSYYSLLWAKKHHVPCVDIQGPYELTRKPIFRQLEWLFDKTFGRWIIKNVNGIGCKTEYAARFVNSFQETDYIITPVGLDISRFNKKTVDYDFREEIGIKKDDKMLLYIGVIENRRHVDTLVKAFEKLPSEYALVIIGAGPRKEELMKYTNDNLQGRKIFWLNKRPQDQLPSVYKAADLFCIATDYEIYGMVVMEAMYYNVPVLSAKTGGTCSLIQDGKTGYLIDGFNPDDWINKIETVFADSTTYSAIKSGLKTCIEEKLLWDKTVDSFIKLYSKALNK